MSTIEVMCENPSVNAHVREWEARCLKAESKLDEARAEVGRLRHDHRYISDIGEASYKALSEKNAELFSDLTRARAEVERLRKSTPYDTQKAMDEVCAENEQLREGLRHVEWVTGPGDDPYCTWCGGWKASGHKPDCWLAALLEAK